MNFEKLKKMRGTQQKKRLLQKVRNLALSVFAPQIHLVPLFGFAIFPRPGEVCQRERQETLRPSPWLSLWESWRVSA